MGPKVLATKPSILLCEGQHDRQFFMHLIEQRGLPPFDVISVDYATGNHHGGTSKVAEALDALAADPGFPRVEKVLVVIDSDYPPPPGQPDPFQYIRAQISATAAFPSGGRFVAPDEPLVASPGTPTVTVLMLPWPGTPGSLDTMCLKAASAKRPAEARHVEDFAINCKVPDWTSFSSITKMKLRSLLTASWEANPWISPAYVWGEETDLVPLGDAIFNQVAAFLQEFQGA